MSTRQQNVVSLVISLAVVLFIGWLGQKPAPSPTGIVSLNATGVAKPQNEQQINLYQSLPPGVRVVGTISAELAFDPQGGEQPQIKQMLAYVRKLAAQAGADSVVVEMFAPRGQVLYFAGRLVAS